MPKKTSRDRKVSPQKTSEEEPLREQNLQLQWTLLAKDQEQVNYLLTREMVSLSEKVDRVIKGINQLGSILSESDKDDSDDEEEDELEEDELDGDDEEDEKPKKRKEL